MQFNIRLSTESSYQVQVAEDASFEDLCEVIKATIPVLPSSFKLISQGEKLETHTTLSDLESTDIILMSNETRKKKKKCSFGTCNSTPLRLVGDCHHCQGKFCAKHRLLEDHCCNGLQGCKDLAHEKNAIKLERERTVLSKV